MRVSTYLGAFCDSSGAEDRRAECVVLCFERVESIGVNSLLLLIVVLYNRLVLVLHAECVHRGGVRGVWVMVVPFR